MTGNHGNDNLLEMERALENAQHGTQRRGCLPSWRTTRRVMLVIALMFMFVAFSGGRGSSFGGIQAGMLLIATAIVIFVAVRTLRPRRR